MATALRALTKTLQGRATSSTLPLTTRSSSQLVPRSCFQASHRLFYSKLQPSKSKINLYPGLATTVAATVATIGTLAYFDMRQHDVLPNHLKDGLAGNFIGPFEPTPEDFQRVYNAIATQLWEKDDYDDGSYGPVLLRLAWHASGTYDAATGTGGSNGATMRFNAESGHGANTGLKHARDFLDPIKQQFPWISYSDLWTLAGVCGIQEMQGPSIPWRPGRQDRDIACCTPDGRLPDASKGQDHIRAIFGRMGFSDQEMVALSGAHALGRCHRDRSGFHGPWTFSPTTVTNDYFILLTKEKWSLKSWAGPKQYEDKTSKSLMMLPTDMALIKDPEFKKHVEKYAGDEQTFFKDFSHVICKLFELGVPFKEGSERMTFRTARAQEK